MTPEDLKNLAAWLETVSDASINLEVWISGRFTVNVSRDDDDAEYPVTVYCNGGTFTVDVE